MNQKMSHERPERQALKTVRLSSANFLLQISVTLEATFFLGMGADTT